MARQSTTPVPFKRTNRYDRGTLYSSGRAGKSVLCAAIPVLRGDSASGKINIAAILAEMPKPLRNAVAATVQAWFVPKTADPSFASYDEFIASYQGEPIKRLGQSDQPPVNFYRTYNSGHFNSVINSDHVQTLGIHSPSGGGVGFNMDLFEAYNLIWNFRAAAHSSHIPLREMYDSSIPADSSYYKFARAFWPQNRFSSVVPDYEAALVQGQLALDVQAGQLPVSGLKIYGANTTFPITEAQNAITQVDMGGGRTVTQIGRGQGGVEIDGSTDAAGDATMRVFAEMGGQRVVTSLADIDKARTTQAFAKMRAAYAGNDTTGYSNDDAIIAELMQGLSVPQEVFKRPWLLDAAVVDFGMIERHATDGASLDQSVTRGMFQQTLSVNLPKQDVGGFIMVVLEVVPHRIYERQGDPALRFNLSNRTAHLPDSLRDVQRPLPVDEVQNWRIDQLHQFPNGLYGFEPMNARWNRDFTRLGGDFYQSNPGSGDFSEARSSLWIPEIIDPAFTADHYLVPSAFPHDVFSDTTGSAFEFQITHNLTFNGLTQFGDVLVEDNDEWAETESAS